MSSEVEAIRAWSGWSPLDRQLADLLVREVGQESSALWSSIALLTWAVRRGDVCVDLERYAARPLAEVLGSTGDDTQRAVDSSILLPELTAWTRLLQASDLVSAGAGDCPLVLDRHRLYLARYYGHETALAARVVERLVSVGSTGAGEQQAQQLLAQWFADGPVEARRAAAIAVERRLCIVTGGPGTGKTSTIVRVLGLLMDWALQLRQNPPRILLLAPTGKAAARLSEAICWAKEHLRETLPEVERLPTKASTIHRALASCRSGADGTRLPLSADILVIDEASMVDLAVMRRLMDAAQRIERLIIVGDPDQLASVQAGAVLGELCHARAAAAGESSSTRATSNSGFRLADHVVELVESHRFQKDSAIGALARCIKNSDFDGTLALLEHSDPTLRFIEPGQHGVQAIERAVLRGYRALWTTTDPETALARLERFRVLCAHRQGRFGVEAWNERIRRSGRAASSGASPQFQGEPILVTENSPDGLLHNGDLGILWRQAAGARGWFALPDGKVVALGPSRLGHFEPAYAMTVHKCQGSEVDEVVVILPDADSPLLTRELLYTAVTRARKACTLVGAREAIRKAVACRIERSSGLSLAITRQIARRQDEQIMERAGDTP